MSDLFAGRTLLIATKHGKEKVIAPVLELALGVKCVVTADLDTDTLGTFTGEVERKDDPIVTARKKCLWGMELTGCDLAVASEGSFGPHPLIGFVPCDDEYLVFLDRAHDVDIAIRELSTETNFAGADVRTTEELLGFACDARFPSHGLIMRKAKDDYTMIVKGIAQPDKLLDAFDYFIRTYGTMYVETDMRAMHNPTRMRVIQRAAEKLAQRLTDLCPQCRFPGFAVTAVHPGLPCALCHAPTRSALNHVYACRKCAFAREEKYPGGKMTENPMYCDLCNP